MPKGKLLIKKEYQLGTVYLLNLRMTWVQDCSYFELCASFNELLFGNMEFLLCLKKKRKEAKHPLSSFTQIHFKTIMHILNSGLLYIYANRK